MERTGCPLVRFLYPHDLFHPLIPEEIPFIQARRISYQSQHDLHGAPAPVDLESLLPQRFLQSFHFRMRCIFLHNDNHTVPPLGSSPASFLLLLFRKKKRDRLLSLSL